MIVAPGSLASSRAAISAVSTLGLTSSPRSSTRKHRSASPSKARPMSAPVSITCACRSTRLAGSIGLASWFGKVPSSSKYSGSHVDVEAAEHGRRGEPGHAVAGVDDDPEVAAGDRRQLEQVRRVVGEHVLLGDRPGHRGGPASRRSPTRSRISARPVSMPIGAAYARHILMPL